MIQNKTENIYLETKTMSCRSLKKDNRKKSMTREQEIKSVIKEIKESMKIKKEPYSCPSEQDNNPEKYQSSEKKIPKTFYTNTFREKVEIRLNEIKDRQRELSAKSFEKQIEAKLRRKIHDNIELKQKMEILNEIKERKEQMLQEKELIKKKNKDEALLLHESNIKNADMIKRMKKRVQKKQLSESKQSEQSSLHDLKFHTFMEEKKKSEKLFEIKSRQQIMLKSKSKSKHKTSMNTLMNSKNFEPITSRVVHTSKSSRDKVKKSEIISENITQSQIYNYDLKNSTKLIKNQKKELSSIVQKKEEESIDLKDIEQSQPNKIDKNNSTNKCNKIDLIYFS